MEYLETVSSIVYFHHSIDQMSFGFFGNRFDWIFRNKKKQNESKFFYIKCVFFVFFDIIVTIILF